MNTNLTGFPFVDGFQKSLHLCAMDESILSIVRPRKKYCLFPVTVWKKNRVGRSVIFFSLFFGSKMCVLCMFYVDWELGGWKKL